MNPTVLAIDTSNQNFVQVSLTIGDIRYEKKSESVVHKSQLTLRLIEALLEEHSLSLTDIRELHVCEGPGSFTGLRVGISIANTMSFLLGIPINGKLDIAKARY